MASVYRIKRKSKEEKAAPVKNPELLTDLDLATTSVPAEHGEDKVEPLAEVSHRVVEETPTDFSMPETKAEETAEAPAESETEDAVLIEEETPAVEDAPAAEETRELDYDEELIRQLTMESENENAGEIPSMKPGEIDFAKLDAVFGHVKKDAAADAETTSLLMQIFGDSESDKKKKKNEAAEEPAAETVEPAETAEETEAAEETEIADEAEVVEETVEAAEELDVAEEIPDAAQETQAFSAIKPNEDGEYVAVHIGEDEKTREYDASLKEKLDNIEPDEVKENETPEVADEFNVPDQTNPYNDTYDELENTGKSRLAVLPEEYTSRDQYDEFAEHLRNRNFRSLLSCVWLFLLFGVVLYLESATFTTFIPHPDFLTPDNPVYGPIYLLVDVQLIFISALLQLPAMGDGIKNLFTGKANHDSFAFLATLFAAVNAALLIPFAPAEAGHYVLFGSVALLFSLLNAVARFLDNKRLYRSFRIAASRHFKFVGEEVAGDSAENEAFRELLPGEQKIYTVQKAELIEDFFKRAKKTPKSQGVFSVAIILTLVLSIGFSVLCYVQKGILAGDPASFAIISATITSFMTTFFLTLPLCGIFTQALPQAHFSGKAEKKDAAIVSLAEAEDCARASVVSFTDKEVFPAKYVKVTTIRTYGQTRIDKAILYAAMIFEKLGGPLSQVFKKTISGVVDEIPEDFDFSEITADGMCAKLEGQDVFVGNKDYMLSYDFGYPKDTMDESFEEHSGKIMYMVIGTELAAKFYIRYSVSSRFKKTLVSLYKAGICPAVKTCDPNIDTNLLQNLLKSDKIPAGVIKTTDAMKDAPMLETSRSGVVCTSSIAGLLQTFVLSDSMVRTVRLNAVLKILSILVGAGAMAYFYFTGQTDKMQTFFVLLYQILWLLPVIIPNLIA